MECVCNISQMEKIYFCTKPINSFAKFQCHLRNALITVNYIVMYKLLVVIKVTNEDNVNFWSNICLHVLVQKVANRMT
jgi:hypothetical protein